MRRPDDEVPVVSCLYLALAVLQLRDGPVISPLLYLIYGSKAVWVGEVQVNGLVHCKGRIQKFLLSKLVDYSINLYSSHPLVAFSGLLVN